MIEIKKLRASRTEKKVLDGASLSIGDCGVLAVIGKNGSGKSTLCECICGILKYDGEILLDGKPIPSMKPKERAKHLAYLPQMLSRPHITVRELIAFGRSPHRSYFSASEADSIAVEDAARLLGIEGLLPSFADEISGGELKKAYLAMTLAQDTRHVILDEPCAHMDIAFEHSFMELVSSLGKEKSFIVVMHDINVAVRYADRIAILDGGKFIFEGESRDSYDAIEASFGIKKYMSGENVFFAP